MNKDEFVRLVKQHEKIIFKVVNLYSDNPDDKQDLIQETILQLWKSMNTFNGTSSFSTWIYRVTLNVSLNFKRNIQKSQTQPLDKLNSAQLQVDEKKDYEMLYLAIRQLSETERMIITLHLDGYGNDEIAEITGSTRNNINVKIFRIKEQISKILKNSNDGY